jgi:hypothetical protein
MQNMLELLEQQPSVCDAPGAGQLALGRGDVAFDNVTFSYWSGPPVLRNVSFSVFGGGTLALVGATGSGKSTCLRLLLRFYDPAAGRVLLDDTDIATVSLASLRRHIAVVPQDTVGAWEGHGSGQYSSAALCGSIVDARFSIVSPPHVQAAICMRHVSATLTAGPFQQLHTLQHQVRAH